MSSQMAGFQEKEKMDRDRHVRENATEDGVIDWSDTSMNQGTPSISSNPQKPGEVWNSLSQNLHKSQTC